MIDLSKDEHYCGGCDLYERNYNPPPSDPSICAPACSVVDHLDRLGFLDNECPCADCLIKMMCRAPCLDRDKYANGLREQVLTRRIKGEI